MTYLGSILNVVRVPLVTILTFNHGIVKENPQHETPEDCISREIPEPHKIIEEEPVIIECIE